MLVIGAGRFGKNLAVTLTKLGNEVLVVDMNEEEVNKIAPQVTRIQIGDCMNRDVLAELGVRNFDVCFVCISDNFQSSMEITSQLKELGAACVVSKSDEDIHADLLKKIGADEVVYPERDMARRTAMRYSAHGAFDYIELSPEYAIMEIVPPARWVGCEIRELDLRLRHNVNIIGIREGDHINPVLRPDHAFLADEHIIIAGEQKNILKLLDK
jgi:K+ transport systems, NAD-binding component